MRSLNLMGTSTYLMSLIQNSYSNLETLCLKSMAATLYTENSILWKVQFLVFSNQKYK